MARAALLVAHTLDSTTATRVPASIQPAIGKCVAAAQTQSGPGALDQCARLYASGVEAGASAQRGTTLTHLLTYSVPFTRLDHRTRHDGFGLGLALVPSIAAVHNGTVHATAMPTGGLDISVRLPRRDGIVPECRPPP
jgi:hypothetical protein